MRKAILESFPRADISVSIIWIEMLPTGNLAVAQKRADAIHDSRVRHFYDPRATRHAGHAFSKGLLNEGAGPAWDIYLFYDKEAQWRDGPQKPADWMHQLGGAGRADPARFHTGEDLISQLRRTVEKFTQAENTSKKE